MNKKIYFVVSILIFAIIIFGFIASNYINSYEKFRWDGGVCQNYYESCSCYGSYAIAQSYPPQYMCGGYEVCEPINKTICR